MRQVTPRGVSPDTARPVSRPVKFGQTGFDIRATAAAPTKSEFPRDAIREAIVNAVCHRDYTSNACVQVMLFRDRLEIINPGPLPQGISVEDLYRTHDSVPRNSLIARAMSWTSYVEKSGSGTGVIIDKCTEHGLARPEFDPTSVTILVDGKRIDPESEIWLSKGRHELKVTAEGCEDVASTIEVSDHLQSSVKLKRK